MKQLPTEGKKFKVVDGWGLDQLDLRCSPSGALKHPFLGFWAMENTKNGSFLGPGQWISAKWS